MTAPTSKGRGSWITPVITALGLMAMISCAASEQARKTGRTSSGTKATDTGGGSHEKGGIRTGASKASQRCARLLPLIRKAAREEGVETSLLVGVIRTESNFRNDVKSSAGAIGLTQCMRATARAKKCGNLSVPYQNLKCGARVLAAFLKYYDGSLVLGLSGYNAGHGMPNAARKEKKLPSNIEYVETVLWARSRFLYLGCDF